MYTSLGIGVAFFFLVPSVHSVAESWATSLDWKYVVDVVVGRKADKSLPLWANFALDALAREPMAVCGSSTSDCAVGIFILQTIALSDLRRRGQLANSQVEELLSPQATFFARHFGPNLANQTPHTLYEHFGSNRSDHSIPEIALMSLGRLLYDMGDLPPLANVSHDYLRNDQFAFGRNWQQFVRNRRLTAEAIMSSAREARRALGGALISLEGLRVLDIGCGSGLHSLGMNMLGAVVTSIDVQAESLDATSLLRAAFLSSSKSVEGWVIEEASVLNVSELLSAGSFDVVYSWGVLHHTGDLWQALHNAQLPIAEDGMLLAAFYADEYYDEKYEIINLKRFYKGATVFEKENLEIAIGIKWLRPLLSDGQNPFEIISNFSQMRGMAFWTDVRDFVGGWPMQFASATSVISFARRAGLRCVGVRRYGGNTEYQLVRPAGIARWTAGRVCVELSGFELDEDRLFESIALQFYFHDSFASFERRSRRWWKRRLPDHFQEFSDGGAEPQRDRLLVMRRAGEQESDLEPFGYPSAQFARQESVNDPELRFHAVWNGDVFVSPTIRSTVAEMVKELVGLSVCLLPPAELDAEQVSVLERRIERGLPMLRAAIRSRMDG